MTAATTRPDVPEARAGVLPPGDRNENPPLPMLELLAEDRATHGGSWWSPGFLALAVHRFGNLRMEVRSKWLRAPLTAAYRAAYHGVIALFGIDLPYNVKIGRRVRFVHHGCIVVGAWSIGDDVIIRGPATLGLTRRDATGTPVIARGVELGPRACVVGHVVVEEGAYVGPNTVLTENLPAGAVALGNPSRRVNLELLAERSEPTPGARDEAAARTAAR
jgi:serine O-acetyltransferase